MILLLLLVSTTDYSGSWDTTYGRMVLTQNGTEVTGYYSYGGISSIEGTVEPSGRLVFTYTEADARGEGWFELADGRISGMWRPEGGTSWSPWEGYLIGSDAGGKWLVILEAEWEEFIDEPQYSFGWMLTEWFRRVPGVQVRHRWFHSAEDLQSLCTEASMLQGDLYLLIASHATVDGVSCREGTIPLTTLLDCIRTVSGNARLVHFSACEIMGGRLPDLVERLSGDVFISGYDRSVDWAASGLIEIYYLNLILEFGLEPETAAETVLASISFAGDKPGVFDDAAGFSWTGASEGGH